MTSNFKQPEKSFYLYWIVLTALCLPIAYFIGVFIITRVITRFVGDYIYVDGVRHITEDYLGIYTLVPLAGLVTGALQYGLLRRYLSNAGWWVLATIGGWVLGVCFVILIFNWSNGVGMFPKIVLDFIMMGFSIGLGQWIFLRRRLPQAAWWIFASVLGWGLASLGGLSAAQNSRLSTQLFLINLTPAIATSIAWWYLFRQKTQPTEIKSVAA